MVMFGVAILLVGFLSFQTWNRKGGHESPLAQDSSGQREGGGGQEESEPPAPEPAGDDKSRDKLSGGKKKSEDKSASKPAAGKEKNGEKSTSEASEGAKTYQIDTKASRIYVRAGSATTSGHPHWMEGKLKSGKVTPGAGGELVVDLKSFKTTPQQAPKGARLEGQQVSENAAKKVNETLPGAGLLDVEKFPTATYQIIIMKPADRQEAGDPGAYHVNGRLTLHGAEQPLRIEAKLERTAKEDVLKLGGVFTIRLSAYGIKPYSGPGGPAGAPDKVEVLADLSLGSEK
jgi:polyisoprenoid-binding protein YceI